jgi:hypothetical protein
MALSKYRQPFAATVPGFSALVVVGGGDGEEMKVQLRTRRVDQEATSPQAAAEALHAALRDEHGFDVPVEVATD